MGPVYGVELTQIAPVLGQEVMDAEILDVTLILLVSYSICHCSPRKDGQMTAKKGNDKLDTGKEFQRILLSNQIS